jgi:hypothetical protein
MQSEELEHCDKIVVGIIDVVIMVVVVGHEPQSCGHDRHVSSESHIPLPQMGLFPTFKRKIMNIIKMTIIDIGISDIFFCFLFFCFFAIIILSLSRTKTYLFRC